MIQRGTRRNEFQPVVRHYPIVFASGDANTYAAVAVLAFSSGLRDGKGGRSVQLARMHRVAEQNLESLNAAQLKELRA